MLFLWLERLRFGQIIWFQLYKKSYVVNNPSIGSKLLVNLEKGVSPSTVYVSSPNVKSEWKYKVKHMFYSFASL